MKIKIIGYSIKGKKHDMHVYRGSRSFNDRRTRPILKDDETIIDNTLTNNPKNYFRKLSKPAWSGKNFKKGELT